MATIRRKPRAVLSNAKNCSHFPLSPVDHGLEDIAAWETWFRNAHEDVLRDHPDTQLIEQERAKVDAPATAIAARMRSDYLVRSTPQ